jgi:uncharacterized repeat protein (TIGR03837 family)
MLCRVIDNFGDVGVTWRLARQLATEQQACVEFWIDDVVRANAIGVASFEDNNGAVTVRQWDSDLPCEPAQCFKGAGLSAMDVVIAAFACQTPDALVKEMQAVQARKGRTVQWINLEYLSAESWIEGSHLLSSPKSGLAETFYFPGWFANTGGLIREKSVRHPPIKNLRARENLLAPLGLAQLVMQDQPALLSAPWIHTFCYPNAPLAELVELLRAQSHQTLLLVPSGVASKTLARLELFGHPRGPRLSESGDCAWFQLGPVTVARVPMVSQDSYDQILAQCNLNLVRGEDSLVRAIWANTPFLWHIYPQEDSAHWGKLQAFLDRVLGQSQSGSPVVAELMHWWNGKQSGLSSEAKSTLLTTLIATSDESAWANETKNLRSTLSNQSDLLTRLLNFADLEQRRAA